MSFKPTRETFIPKGSIKVKPRDVDAIIYLFEQNGSPCALAFGGKRNKPDLHVRYRSVASRERALLEYVERASKVKAYKDEQAAARKGFKHTFKVGDVLHYSWGYDQTQCEFFQIVSLTPGTVTMREIAQKTAPGSELPHGMAENRLAVPNNFLDKSQPITKRVTYAASGPGHVPMKHGCASLWDGSPKYCSWYA